MWCGGEWRSAVNLLSTKIRCAQASSPFISLTKMPVIYGGEENTYTHTRFNSKTLVAGQTTKHRGEDLLLIFYCLAPEIRNKLNLVSIRLTCLLTCSMCPFNLQKSFVNLFIRLTCQNFSTEKHSSAQLNSNTDSVKMSSMWLLNECTKNHKNNGQIGHSTAPIYCSKNYTLAWTFYVRF